MTLLESSLRGSQVPRLSSLPVGVVSDAPGRAAVAQARAAGLELDPWQQLVLRESLGVRSDGKWAAFSVGLIVPRQNGKGAVLEALALAMLFQFRAELVVWTAHEMKTAKEGFRRLVALIKNTPDLDAQVKPNGYRHGNDDRGIELRTGARIQFLARSSGSGRGFSGDCVILDEAYKLDGDTMAALLPTLSAVPNPQIWYTSSAPFATSEQLHKVRKRGLAGDDPRMAFFEWSMPDGDDPSSPVSWALANPGYPERISDEAIQAEWREFGADDNPAVFKRERLGVPDELPGVLSAIPGWGELADPSRQSPDAVQMAFDVSPSRDRAAFGAAWRRGDGLFHVEPIDCRPGTEWAVASAQALFEKWRVPVRIQAGSPAASFVSLFREAGVDVEEVTQADLARGVGMLLDAAASGSLRHPGATSLDGAVRGAELRPSGDVDIWMRRSPRADITPLVAVTLALAGVPLVERKPRIHTLNGG